MSRVFLSYITAVFATYLFGVIFNSQGNIASVLSLGFDVTTLQRISAALHDFSNMTTLYLPLIALTTLCSYSTAALIIKYLPQFRLIGFVLAGFVGLVLMHLVIKTTFGISGIASTRTTIGLLSQGLAGAIGGYLFYRLSTKPANPW